MGAIQRLCANKKKRINFFPQEEIDVELNKLVSQHFHELYEKDKNAQRLQ